MTLNRIKELFLTVFDKIWDMQATLNDEGNKRTNHINVTFKAIKEGELFFVEFRDYYGCKQGCDSVHYFIEVTRGDKPNITTIDRRFVGLLEHVKKELKDEQIKNS